MWFFSKKNTKNDFNNNVTNDQEKITYKSQEFSWRAKGDLISLKTHPNFLKFIISLEEEYDIWIGLHVDFISIDGNKSCMFKIIVYDQDSKERFMFFISFYPNIFGSDTSYLGGLICDLNSLKDVKNPDYTDKYLVRVTLKGFNDLEVLEYRSHFNSLLISALVQVGVNPSDYFLKKLNGGVCFHKFCNSQLKK